MQRCTQENMVEPCTRRTGNVPQVWLKDLIIPEEQRVAAALKHKLRLG